MCSRIRSGSVAPPFHYFLHLYYFSLFLQFLTTNNFTTASSNFINFPQFSIIVPILIIPYISSTVHTLSAPYLYTITTPHIHNSQLQKYFPIISIILAIQFFVHFFNNLYSPQDISHQLHAHQKPLSNRAKPYYNLLPQHFQPTFFAYP